jgi:hypothetical protein
VKTPLTATQAVGIGLVVGAVGMILLMLSFAIGVLK